MPQHDWRVTWERNTQPLTGEETWMDEEFIADEVAVLDVYRSITSEDKAGMFRNVKLWQCRWLPATDPKEKQ